VNYLVELVNGFSYITVYDLTHIVCDNKYFNYCSRARPLHSRAALPATSPRRSARVRFMRDLSEREERRAMQHAIFIKCDYKSVKEPSREYIYSRICSR